MLNSPAAMGKLKVSERLWRFVAAVMLFSVAWTIWIIDQLNPPPLVTNAAFEAAAPAAPETPKQPPVDADKLKLTESLTIPGLQ